MEDLMEDLLLFDKMASENPSLLGRCVRETA